MTEWNAEIAEWYADNYGEYPTNRLAIDALGLPMDAVVLDIGCGTGAALRHAAPRVTQGRLIGVDPVPLLCWPSTLSTIGKTPRSASARCTESYGREAGSRSSRMDTPLGKGRLAAR